MLNKQIRKGRNCVFLMHVHLVFVTKYRSNVLKSIHLQYIEDVTRVICEQKDCVLKEFNGEGDHIHLLIDYPPKVSVSKLVNAIKGVTSRRLKQNYPSLSSSFYKGALWSPSYFAGSVGGATLDVVKKYIEQQNRPK